MASTLDADLAATEAPSPVTKSSGSTLDQSLAEQEVTPESLIAGTVKAGGTDVKTSPWYDSVAQKLFHHDLSSFEPLGAMEAGAMAIPAGAVLGSGLKAAGMAGKYATPILESMTAPAESIGSMAKAMTSSAVAAGVGHAVADSQYVPDWAKPTVDTGVQMLTAPVSDKVLTLGSGLAKGASQLARSAMGKPDLAAAKLRELNLPENAALSTEIPSSSPLEAKVTTTTQAAKDKVASLPGGLPLDTYGEQAQAQGNKVALAGLPKLQTNLANAQQDAIDSAKALGGNYKTVENAAGNSTDVQEAGKDLAQSIAEPAKLIGENEKRLWNNVPLETPLPDYEAFHNIANSYNSSIKTSAGETLTPLEQNIVSTVQNWGPGTSIGDVQGVGKLIGNQIRNLQDGSTVLTNGASKQEVIGRLQKLRGNLFDEMGAQGSDPSIFHQGLAAQGYEPAIAAIKANQAVQDLQLAKQQSIRKHEIFEGAPGDPHEIGQILARNSQGERLDPEDITKLITSTPSGMQRAVRAMSGEGLVLGYDDAGNFSEMHPNYERGRDKLSQLVAFDARKAGALTPNGADPEAFAKWKASRDQALQVLGDKAAPFEQAQTAGQKVQEAQTAVDALHEANPIKAGVSGLKTAQDYFPAGPEGRGAATKFLSDMGGINPTSANLAKNILANQYREKVLDPVTGVVRTAAHENFMGQYKPAFDALPKTVRAQFKDAGTAQKTVDESLHLQSLSNRLFEQQSLTKAGLHAAEDEDNSVLGAANKSDRGASINQLVTTVNNSKLAPEEKEAALKYVKDRLSAFYLNNSRSGGDVPSAEIAKLIQNNKPGLARLYDPEGYKMLQTLHDAIVHDPDLSEREAKYLGQRSLAYFSAHKLGPWAAGALGAGAEGANLAGHEGAGLGLGLAAGGAYLGHLGYQRAMSTTNEALIQAISDPVFRKNLLATNSSTPLGLRRALASLPPPTVYGISSLLGHTVEEPYDKQQPK